MLHKAPSNRKDIKHFCIFATETKTNSKTLLTKFFENFPAGGYTTGANKMKYVYYIVDSTIFNNDEELFKALTKGTTIVNDKADLEFSIGKNCKLHIEHRFSGEEAINIKPTLWKAENIIAQMDDVVAKVANRHKWESLTEAVYRNK